MLFNDRDADAVKIDPKMISFKTRLGSWHIHQDGKIEAVVQRPYGVDLYDGTCKVVD